MTDFRWLIEAPGQRYLAVQRLRMSDSFHWSSDHDQAICFKSEEQADATMMAIRGIAPHLFEFERTIGNAKAFEHGWMGSGADVGGAPK